MYIPAVALAKRHNLVVSYWRTPYVHSDSTGWMMNDSQAFPDAEMMLPKTTCHYRLEDSSGTTTAIEQYRGRNGTYTGGTRATGPKISLVGGSNGRGGGSYSDQAQDVFTSNHNWSGGTGTTPPFMTGPQPMDPSGTPIPSAANLNPVGINAYPFTVSVWVKITDNQTTFGGGTNDNISGPHWNPVVSIRRFKESSGSFGASAGWKANLELKRSGTNSQDGCYAIRAVHHTNSDDGTDELVAEADITTAPQVYQIGSDNWCLVSAIFRDDSIALYANGSLLHTESRLSQHLAGGDSAESSPSAFVWPAQSHFQIALNTDLSDSSRKGVPKVSYSHLSVYPSALTEHDMARQASSMLRWFDMKLPYETRPEGDWHWGVPMHSIYTWPANQFPSAGDRFTAASKAQFRNDARYTAVYHLANPVVDMNDDNLDLDDHTPTIGPKVKQGMVPRAWINNRPSIDAPGGLVDDQANHTFATTISDLMGGHWFGAKESSRHSTTGNGMTLITGWCGTPNIARNTMLFNYKGQAPSGQTSYRSWAGCNLGANDIPDGVNGNDGFALWIESSSFKFWCPYETKTLFNVPPAYGDVYNTTYDIGSGALRSNEYQALGVTVNPDAGGNPLCWVFTPQPNMGNQMQTEIAAGGLQNWPGGGAALARIPRNQAPFFPSMNYVNKTIVGGSGTQPYHTLPESGSPLAADDYNRYGPLLLCADNISANRLKQITRLMHGQPLMRSRPALRGCSRHMTFTAPTRVLT